jgi:hypothetical protein
MRDVRNGAVREKFARTFMRTFAICSRERSLSNEQRTFALCSAFVRDLFRRSFALSRPVPSRPVPNPSYPDPFQPAEKYLNDYDPCPRSGSGRARVRVTVSGQWSPGIIEGAGRRREPCAATVRLLPDRGSYGEDVVDKKPKIHDSGGA